MCGTIEIEQDVRAENLHRSGHLREHFAHHGVRVIGLLGSPGSGKTTLLENILPALSEKMRVAVIEGDIATENDARRIRELGVEAVQINTDGACHLDTAMVEKALRQIDLDAIDLLIIENVGNLVNHGGRLPSWRDAQAGGHQRRGGRRQTAEVPVRRAPYRRDGRDQDGYRRIHPRGPRQDGRICPAGQSGY